MSGGSAAPRSAELVTRPRLLTRVAALGLAAPATAAVAAPTIVPAGAAQSQAAIGHEELLWLDA